MFRNIIKIFTGTFVSRVFGFIREIIVASFFGTSRIADAFTLALTFPNLFRQILGEDMVERAFMPPFKTRYDEGKIAESWRYLSIVFNWFFIALLLGTFVLYLVVPLFFSMRDWFPNIFHFVFSKESFDYDLTLKLVLILLPFMVLIGLAAFIGSLLNFFEKNWIFGFAPAMLSVGVIIGVYFFKDSLGGVSIAIGYLMGALMQLLIQLPFVFNKKFKRETSYKYSGFILSDKKQSFKSIKRESRFITLNALFDKTQEVFGRFFAATLITGSTSSLFYAARLFQLPFAVISLPITRGINPMLNKMKATRDLAGFNNTFFKGLNLYFLLFFPVTSLMIISSDELVNLVFMRGKFDTNALQLTSKAFMAYSVGLLPMSLVGYFKRVLSLFENNKYTLYVSIIGAGLNILFALTLVKFTTLNHEGIALASSLAYTVNMFVLGRFTFKHINDYLTNRINYLNVFVLLLISIFVISISQYFDFHFYASKSGALVSILVKTVVIVTIFGGIYFLNPKFRSILSGLFKRK